MRYLLWFIIILIGFGRLPAQDGYLFTTLVNAHDPNNPPRSLPWIPRAVAVGPQGEIYASSGSAIRRVAVDGTSTIVIGNTSEPDIVDGSTEMARFYSVSSMSFSADGALYIADYSKLRRITPEFESVTSIGGALLPFPEPTGPVIMMPGANGSGVSGVFPFSVTADHEGTLFFTEFDSHAIRKLTRNGVLSTYAGSIGEAGANDGRNADARFKSPAGIVVDTSGNVFVNDAGNKTIRMITPAGQVSTFVGTAGRVGIADGTGSDARFGQIRFFTIGAGGLTIDIEGNLFLCDTGNYRVRKIAKNGVVTTLGGGNGGYADGLGEYAQFFSPGSIAVDPSGNLFLVDNVMLRKGTPVWGPKFAMQPQSQGAPVDGETTLSTVVSGTPTPTLQWLKNGAPIPGATNSSLKLSNAQLSDSGAYTVVATNLVASVTSSVATVTIGSLPAITSQPQTQTVALGQALNLTVATDGTSRSFQWLKDGTPIPGATFATFSQPAATVADAGTYSVVVTSAVGSVTSSAATVAVNTSRIVNLSIRSSISAASPLLTVGFVVSGSGKSLLVRGVGPTLANYGVSGTLLDPRITLFSGNNPVASNDDWGRAANPDQMASTFAHVGAFGLSSGSSDAALLALCDNGNYSAQISGPSNQSGIVLVELYDANDTTASRLVNVSARAQVGTGDAILVAGFVVTGNSKKTLLIRAVGPTLSAFGVGGALADPQLDVIAGSSGTTVSANDNWGGAAALSAAFVAQGAFPFASADSRDAAVLVTLDPGSYSAQVTGVGATTGEALIEIYEVR